MSQHEAASAVNARLKAIMRADAAQGREALAEHLAFETEMSAEEAIALMNVAPRGADEASSPHQEREYQPPKRLMSPEFRAQLNAEGLNSESGRGRSQAGKGKLAANMKRRHGVE